MIQQLDTLVAAAVKRVEALEITTLEIVDRGDGSSVVAVLGNFARGVSKVLEETGTALGIDVKALLAHQPAAPELPPGTERGMR